MRRRRLLLVALAMGGGLLGALALVGARVPRAAIVAELERALGHPLEVGRVRVHFGPRPALELLDVRADAVGVVAGSLATFEAERIRLRLAFVPLLGGRAVIDRVLDASSGTFGLRLMLPNENFQIPAGIRCKVKF